MTMVGLLMLLFAGALHHLWGVHLVRELRAYREPHPRRRG
jgi:hypothetical protein